MWKISVFTVENDWIHIRQTCIRTLHSRQDFFSRLFWSHFLHRSSSLGNLWKLGLGWEWTSLFCCSWWRRSTWSHRLRYCYCFPTHKVAIGWKCVCAHLGLNYLRSWGPQHEQLPMSMWQKSAKSKKLHVTNCMAFLYEKNEVYNTPVVSLNIKTSCLPGKIRIFIQNFIFFFLIKGFFVQHKILFSPASFFGQSLSFWTLKNVN